MTDPGAGCGSPTGNTDDAEDLFMFASSDSNHESSGGGFTTMTTSQGDDGHAWELRISRCLFTNGTRVTAPVGPTRQDKTVNYRLGTEDEAAFAALTVTLSVDPNGTDTELCDERTHDIMFMGDDEAACHITQDNGSSAGGGDDKEDAAAARFTLVDFFTGATDESTIFGAADPHPDEVRGLVAA